MSSTYPYTYPITYPILKTHDFFDKTVQTRIVIPGKVTIKSHPLQEESYTGVAQDADYDTYSSEQQIPETLYMRITPTDTLTGNEVATLLATARLRSHQLGASRGQGSMPLLNLGQEVYDYVLMTDSRAGDTTTGIVLAFDEHVAPGKFDMTLSFGPDIKAFVPLMYDMTLTELPKPAVVSTELFEKLWDYTLELGLAFNDLRGIVIANARKTDANTNTFFYAAKPVPMFPISSTTVLTTGDITDFRFPVPVDLHGMDLIDVEATVITASTSGVPQIKLQISTDHGVNWNDMLSTDITIDENEYRSEDAATAPVIDTTYSEVSTGDLIRVNVEVAGTNTAGLILRTRFARV